MVEKDVALLLPVFVLFLHMINAAFHMGFHCKLVVTNTD